MTKEARIYNGVKTVSSINSVGKIGQIDAKKEAELSSYTLYKNRLKMD